MSQKVKKIGSLVFMLSDDSSVSALDQLTLCPFRKLSETEQTVADLRSELHDKDAQMNDLRSCLEHGGCLFNSQTLSKYP